MTIRPLDHERDAPACDAIIIRPLDHERDAPACDAIVAGLRAWFGAEQGILDCAAAVRAQAGLVAIDRDAARNPRREDDPRLRPTPSVPELPVATGGGETTGDPFMLDRDRRTGVIGFLTWEPSGGRGAEITWMAVRADVRRRGIGRLLLDELVRQLRGSGISRLDVKTLSARDPYPPYVETRAFYRANGFAEIAELDVWGPENPAVLLSRTL